MMSRTTDLCSRRSRRAAATVVSPRTSPQEVMGRLVVTIVEVLVYRWAITWNSAEAPSACNGR